MNKDFLNSIVLRDNMYYFHVNSTNNNDIVLFDCGFEQFTNSLKVINQSYPYYIMHYVLDGKGYVKINNYIHEIQENNVFIIPPNIPVQYFQDINNPWSYIWINFGGLNAKSYVEELDYSQNSITKIIHSEKIVEFFKTFILSDNSDNAFNFKSLSIFYEILYLLKKESNHSLHNTINTTYSNNYLLKALNLVETKYDQNLTISDICQSLHLNESYFSKIFHEKMGSTFTEYLSMHRIQKATELLEKTNLTINQISQMVGFSNQFYFSNVFKKYRLVSPKKYRELNKANK
ncbi:MAG: hypothetical protein DBX39_06670 [Bacillota bacterium]|nr:MAG: hypothetical protein DBX39_06670 [Bacillota bacterium]